MNNTTLVPPSDGRIEGKDITKLGELWQEEIMNLSETTPESLDALENRIQDILPRHSSKTFFIVLGRQLWNGNLLNGIHLCIKTNALSVTAKSITVSEQNRY